MFYLFWNVVMFTRVFLGNFSLYICFQHLRVWWEPSYISIILQNTKLQKFQMSIIISHMKNMGSELDFTLNVLLVAYSLWRLYSTLWIRYMPNEAMHLPIYSSQQPLVNIWVSWQQLAKNPQETVLMLNVKKHLL